MILYITLYLKQLLTVKNHTNGKPLPNLPVLVWLFKPVKPLWQYITWEAGVLDGRRFSLIEYNDCFLLYSSVLSYIFILVYLVISISNISSVITYNLVNYVFSPWICHTYGEIRSYSINLQYLRPMYFHLFYIY